MTLMCAQLFGVIFATSAYAQTDLLTSAQEATKKLDKASIDLVAAYRAKNRVAALTKTIRAFELGSASVRQGLRRIAIKKAQVSAKINQQELETNRLIGVLYSINKTPQFQYLVHPDGALKTARAGMIVADILPALQLSIAPLKQNLEELEALNQIQKETQDALSIGLLDLQQARTALSQAIAKRIELPKRYIEDPAKTALLVAASQSLAEFVKGLEIIATQTVEGSLPDIENRKGNLPMPVLGRVLRQFNEADAAGIKRPGVIIAAAPGAIVTSPTAATLRYRGELLDYGLVSILEPQNDVLIVIAGLGVVFGDIGDVLPAGSPVGLMGGNTSPEFTTALAKSNTASDRSETLYIEIRKDETPQDPLMWFQQVKEDPL